MTRKNTLNSLTGPRGGIRAAADEIRRRGGTASMGYLAACSQCPGKKMAARIFRKHGVRADYKSLNRLIMAHDKWRWTPALTLYINTVAAKQKAAAEGTRLVNGGYRSDWNAGCGHIAHVVVLRSGRKSGNYGDFGSKRFSL